MRSEFLPFAFPARSTRPLAIMHVTVVPMDSNRILPDHTVLIENGRITAMAPSSSLEMEGRSEVTIVDGRGRFLMPGLADMYTHYREPAEAPLYLSHGITTARTSGNPFQLALEWSAARGEFPSPRVVTVTLGIDGIGPTGRTDMPHGIPLINPEDAAALVRKHADRGYHQIMPFSLLTPENLAAVGRAAAERGLRVVGNCPNAMSWEEAVKAGMSGFQQLHLIARDHMLDEYGGETYWDRFDPAPGTKLDFEKIRRLGGFLAKHQAWSLPTVAFHQRASQPAEISLAHPSLRYVPQSSINDWETTIVRWGRRGRVTAEEWRRLASERAIAFHKVIGIFHQEGAPQLTCTDGVNPYNVQGDTLHQEIENFATAGMSAYEALRCTTSEAARFMNQQDDWGTLGVGKRADMILINANPLEDVRATRDIEAVFVNNYYLPRADLDNLLEQRLRLVNGQPAVASTALPAASGSGSPIDEGAWLERICGADFGKVDYRHTRLPDSGWLIEERHAGAEPRRHPARRSSRIVLDADLCVRHADYEIETFVGTESGKIERHDDGYHLHHVAVDGFASTSHLPGQPRAPSEHMALSVVPLLARCRRASTIEALDADSTLNSAELVLAESEEASPGSNGVNWQLHASRLGERASQTYHLGSDGRLQEMTETTVLLWPRQLISVKQVDAEDAKADEMKLVGEWPSSA
jgi:hypothetical protein